MAEAAETSEAVKRPTVEEIREEVRKDEDPELRMSIVDLGLVYHVGIDDEGFVTIDLTLTTPPPARSGRCCRGRRTSWSRSWRASRTSR